MKRLRVAVLISGRGSNLRALLEAAASPAYPAEITLVLSNRRGAGGLAHARRADVPTAVVDHTAFADRAAFERAMEAEIAAAGVEAICLAGFMRRLTAGFVERWRDRMINIHPSLLPAFAGLDTHRRALEAGVRFTGCSVHFVRTEVDSGPIIVQATVPVLPGDDEERLAARVLTAEHRCYPLALRLLAEGRLTIVGERVEISDGRAPDTVAINPMP
ncbi:MAG: phosphoribosylglycinamide formyltransferase [Inquilinus sp.]|nr:phosphoribosylglycinamide formyltransferase [Inquilinus sp.]